MRRRKSFKYGMRLFQSQFLLSRFAIKKNFGVNSSIHSKYLLKCYYSPLLDSLLRIKKASIVLLRRVYERLHTIKHNNRCNTFICWCGISKNHILIFLISFIIMN